MLKWVVERIKKELSELSGAEFVDDKTSEKRISVCENCPGNKFRYLSRQCKVCGCFMDVKTKIKKLPLTGTVIECPENYWT
jgi:hypothetical protein